MRTRNTTLALAAAALLLAAPAFAQSSSSTHSSNSSPSSSSSSSMSASDVAQLRQKIKHDLEQDGFTNVHVVPDSFLVNAQNKQGQPVVMIINPNSVFSVTQVGKMNSGSSGAGTGSSGSASNTSGTKKE